MKYELKIKVGKTRQNQRWESFSYESEDERDTVATALLRLPVRWDHSCHQKKCGACAMVVNGSPVLACDTRLADLKGKIRIEPLRKFPLVEDLVVDRSVLQDNLKALGSWKTEGSTMKSGGDDEAYEASRCLQCGLCLEACPNFYVGGDFYGTAVLGPSTRLLSKFEKEDTKDIQKEYKRHLYSHCGKALACRNVCPAGIDIDRLLVKSNAIAVWHRG